MSVPVDLESVEGVAGGAVFPVVKVAALAATLGGAAALVWFVRTRGESIAAVLLLAAWLLDG